MKKKGFLLASAVGAVLAPVAGQAADMAPVYKSPPPVPVAANWTGFYIGASAGAAWTHGESDHYANDTNVRSQSKTQGIFGGTIGYNWQLGSYLFGLEADGSGLGNSGTHLGSGAYDAERNRINWLVTARVRTGLVVGDTMAYVTGGVAFAGVRNCARCGADSEAVVQDKSSRVGWTVGGGVEHMFTRNWTFAIEGLFVDLGRKVVDNSKVGSFAFTNQAVIGRFKVNYKF